MDALRFPGPEPAFGPLAPFWEAAQRSELRLPRCPRCGTFDWYPTGACPGCGDGKLQWERLSGRGALFSWAIVNRALHAPLAPLEPYISAIVTIAEDSRVRLVTRLCEADPATLRADMPVQIRFADLGYPALKTGVRAPLFIPLSQD